MDRDAAGCVRMRGITPARPQFETPPLLLDVIEVFRPLNKTGLYSREAYIRGSTVYGVTALNTCIIIIIIIIIHTTVGAADKQ